MEQAANSIQIHGFCRPGEPIEGGESIVVPGLRIGPVIKQNLDGLHETCFGGIVQRGCPSAVGDLDSLSSVIYPRAVPQKRRDVLGIVLSTLISCARIPDPISRTVDTSSSARASAPALDA
jgi:hypothetical protein